MEIRAALLFGHLAEKSLEYMLKDACESTSIILISLVLVAIQVWCLPQSACAQAPKTVEIRSAAEIAVSPRDATLSLDLLAIPVDKTPEGQPDWTRAEVVQKAAAKPGQVSRRIIPPEMKGPGLFAQADFKGAETNWEGFDRLELEVTSQGNTQFALVLYEWDGGKRESYSLNIPLLQPGLQKIVFKLNVSPQGDLRPTSPGIDHAWNPDSQNGVQLLLSDYPSGLAIESLKLIKSASPSQASGGIE